MKPLRNPQWLLILLFLGIISAVPLIQAVVEVRREEDVQAFNVFRQAPTAANLRAYEHSLEDANWAARASRPWMQFGQFEWLKYGGEKVAIGEAGWYFYKPGIHYLLARTSPEETAQATNDPFTAIVDFRDQLAARGIRLMVMPAPNKESVYPDRLTSRAKAPHGVLSPRTQDLINRLRAADVEVIDLFRTFTEARHDTQGTEPLYLAQDTHWSPAGVQLAARTVARRLIELGWVRPGQTQYDERPAPVPRLGDVLRMLQVPRIERLTTPETVACVQVIRRDNGEPYRDGLGGEVLVLGDSFMRIYQNDEPGSAGFIAHLAKELGQPLLSVVNDGGGSTLVRRELQGRAALLRTKPVVLWEFVERDIGLGLEGWQQVPLPEAPSRVSGSASAPEESSGRGPQPRTN